MEQEVKKLHFQMLGRFAVFYGGTELKLDKSGTSNMIQMLSMIVFRREGIPRDELLQNLYGDKPLADRNNNLRVTLFKLRKMLANAGLPEESYVALSSDIYRWSTDIPTSCDVWDFRRLIREADQAQNAGDAESEISLRLEACRIYGGELLPTIFFKEWVLMEAVSLKAKYTACLRRLCGLLEEKGRYREIVELCTAAQNIYPFDEWQIVVIDALMALRQYDEALAAYQKFTDYYYHELGLSPTVEMLTRYQKICSAIQYQCSSPDEIYWGLVEKEPDRIGAVYVSYPSFIDRFRFLQRISERSGESNFLVVATMQSRTGDQLSKNDVGSLVDEKIRSVLRSCLRRTDTFTKFNTAQYLILLVGIDMESVDGVTARISDALARAGGSLRVACRYRALPMNHPEQSVQQLGWNFSEPPRNGGEP